MGIFLIVIILLILCWPMIKRWTARFMANRAEDFIRNATGMPPRPGSRKARQQQREAAGSSQRQQAYQSRRGHQSRRSSSRGTWHYSDGPIIPKEYAEDVEFVETIDYPETQIHTDDRFRRDSETYHESQVSDAEWEEIKK